MWSRYTAEEIGTGAKASNVPMDGGPTSAREAAGWSVGKKDNRGKRTGGQRPFKLKVRELGSGSVDAIGDRGGEGGDPNPMDVEAINM